MAAMKDTDGRLRLQYLQKMMLAEELYDQDMQAIKQLKAEQNRLIVGTHAWQDLNVKIFNKERVRDHHLAEFHAYAAALTAVSTAILK